MSLASLPPEIQDEILFHIVLTNSRIYQMREVINDDIMPYIQASHLALQCWRSSWHLILHRVAAIRLAATEAYRRLLRREWVLAKLRMLLWRALFFETYLPESENNMTVYEIMSIAVSAYWPARIFWEHEEYHADHWRQFLLRR
jgi:hypothetical protein